MIFRVLDIETIPDPEAWKPKETSYRLVPGDYFISPRIGAAVTSVRVDGGSAPVLEPVPPFPPPHAQRVVAISFVDVVFDAKSDPKYRYDRCYSECLWSHDGVASKADAAERKLLCTFGEAMSGGDGGESSQVHLVTWNGRSFDLPVIVLRSLRAGVSCGWYYANRNVRYRYTAEGHLDLMDYYADFGGCRYMSLNDACHLVGLPGKTDMSGDKVEDVWRGVQGRTLEESDAAAAEVARYCLQDSLQTAIFFVRSRHHFGKVTSEAHNAILRTFRDSPQVQSAIEVDWDRIML